LEDYLAKHKQLNKEEITMDKTIGIAFRTPDNLAERLGQFDPNMSVSDMIDELNGYAEAED
jgi:hypothetical protein